MNKPTLQIGNGSWGGKNGSLLGYVEGDTVEKFAPFPLVSHRDTNLGATRVGKDGLIEKGRENLLSYSNGFSNSSWIKVSSSAGDGTTIEGGYDGYDGTPNAWLLSKTNQQYGGLDKSVALSGVKTFSVYVKAGSVNWVRLYATGYAFFNLSGSGSVGAQSGFINASITPVGNDGWFRISVSHNGTLTGSVVKINPAIGDNNLGLNRDEGGGGTGSVYIQDAQLERGIGLGSYIETGSPRNLFTNSNNLSDSDWAKNDITVEGNQLGYDGTHNAWKFTKTAAAYKQISQTIEGSNVVRTISVYAKAGSLDHVSLFHRDNDQDPAPDSGKKFDLIRGVVEAAGSAGSAISASMKDVGNGWYRCQMTYNHTGGNVVRIYADFNETTAGYIFIQNPQIEDASSASEYSGTSSYAGLNEDTPRIDYTESEGYLLMEPRRINLVPSSEFFSSGVTLKDVTATDVYATSPEGIKNAARITTNTADDSHFVLQGNLSVTSGETYTWSAFVKANGYNYAAVRITAAGSLFNAGSIRVRLKDDDSGSAGVITVDDSNVTGTVTDYGNGWYRISATGTAIATGSGGATRVQLHHQATGAEAFQGDGVGGILVYGTQFEKGKFISSYIPTHGSSVTRKQDVITFDKDIAYEGWTVYMEVDNMTIDGAASNTGHWFFRGQGNENVSALFFFGTCFGYRATDGTNKYICGKLGNTGDVFSGKWAVTYDGVNTIKVYVDGSQDGSATDVDPNFAKGIQSGGLQYQSSDTISTKNIKDLRVYDKTLTQAEAEALTA